jgi:hypothetical protein
MAILSSHAGDENEDGDASDHSVTGAFCAVYSFF